MFSETLCVCVAAHDYLNTVAKILLLSYKVKLPGIFPVT